MDKKRPIHPESIKVGDNVVIFCPNNSCGNGFTLATVLSVHSPSFKQLELLPNKMSSPSSPMSTQQMWQYVVRFYLFPEDTQFRREAFHIRASVFLSIERVATVGFAQILQKANIAPFSKNNENENSQHQLPVAKEEVLTKKSSVLFPDSKYIFKFWYSSKLDIYFRARHDKISKEKLTRSQKDMALLTTASQNSGINICDLDYVGSDAFFCPPDMFFKYSKHKNDMNWRRYCHRCRVAYYPQCEIKPCPAGADQCKKAYCKKCMPLVIICLRQYQQISTSKQHSQIQKKRKFREGNVFGCQCCVSDTCCLRCQHKQCMSISRTSIMQKVLDPGIKSTLFSKFKRHNDTLSDHVSQVKTSRNVLSPHDKSWQINVRMGENLGIYSHALYAQTLRRLSLVGSIIQFRFEPLWAHGATGSYSNPIEDHVQSSCYRCEGIIRAFSVMTGEHLVEWLK